VTPIKIEPSATDGEVLLTTGGAVAWGTVPAGAVDSDGTTIVGDGSTTDLSVPNGGIDEAQIAADAVTTDKIANDAINADKISAGAITGPKMAINSVQGSFGGTSVIVAGSIGQADIGNNAIGNGEIQTGAVRTGEILDGTIADADISGTAAIAGSKITPTFTAQIDATLGMTSGADILMNGNMVVPDYVFQKYFLGTSNLKENYEFRNLTEIETFIKKFHHLPGIKSAAQVKEEGSWNLSTSNLQNLEKIEELFLHTIAQEKEISKLKTENKTLARELATMKNDLEEIKSLLKKSE